MCTCNGVGQLICKKNKAAGLLQALGSITRLCTAHGPYCLGPVSLEKEKHPPATLCERAKQQTFCRKSVIESRNFFLENWQLEFFLLGARKTKRHAYLIGKYIVKEPSYYPAPRTIAEHFTLASEQKKICSFSSLLLYSLDLFVIRRSFWNK